ncbi:MAG: 50S ribosomal protein L29 [Bacteroidota bacterium]
MASKKNEEIRAMSNEILQDELEASVVELQKMKFSNAVTGLDNPLQIKELRRDIARIKTELRKREMDEMSEDQLAKRSKIRARRRKR